MCGSIGSTSARKRRASCCLSYVERANELDRRPEFYNSLLTNCTTVIFGMARAMDPGITLDRRVLLSGLLPGYLF